MGKTIFVFLAQGFEITEALGTVDVLRRAKLETKTVSITSSLEVESSNGITVKADMLFNEIDTNSIAALVCPGGIPGMNNLDSYKPLTDLIKKHYEEGGLIAAICAGPSIFGHLGLLEGKNAICYPGFEKELKGATISTDAVVRDGNIITAKGMGVSLQFGLEIVRAMSGNDVARETANSAIIA